MSSRSADMLASARNLSQRLPCLYPAAMPLIAGLLHAGAQLSWPAKSGYCLLPHQRRSDGVAQQVAPLLDPYLSPISTVQAASVMDSGEPCPLLISIWSTEMCFCAPCVL